MQIFVRIEDNKISLKTDSYGIFPLLWRIVIINFYQLLKSQKHSFVEL